MPLDGHVHYAGRGMPRYLEYRAGPAALARVRAGFELSDVRTFVLPATGPKWLVSVGFDRAIMRRGLLAHGAPVLLAGASAGAWRAIAMACRDPLVAHEHLFEEYITKVFTRAHTPEQIGEEYRATLARVVSRDDAEHALAHPHYRLALHAVRVKGWAGARGAAQWMALGTAALAHAFAPQAPLFLEHTLFAGGNVPHAWLERGAVLRAELTPENLHAVALASGSVPLYMAPVHIAHDGTLAPYLDGGLSDYHLRRPLGEHTAIALMFHHQLRMLPAWFDRYMPWRTPSRAATENLLLVHPTDAFYDVLPDRQVPTRTDFTRFVADPAARIARWRKAAAASERLGEQFLEDLDGGRIAALVRPLSAGGS